MSSGKGTVNGLLAKVPYLGSPEETPEASARDGHITSLPCSHGS